MRIINLIIFTTIFSLFICCAKKEDNHHFNGKIQYFDDSCVLVKNVKSKSVPLNGAIMSMIAVYDSLLVCWNPDHPNHFFDIFNVDTGEKIGSFCQKGRGAKESISVNCVYQFFKKGNDLMTLLYGSNEGKLFFWNISQSIKDGVTVYDTIVPYKNNSITFQFYQSEDTLLLYKGAEEISLTQITMPFYEKRTIYTNDFIRKYPIYKGDSIEESRVAHPVGTFYYTWDVMKPDGTKIVQVMWQLPQLNMIDIQTGDIWGYRMKNGPDYSLLKTDMESMNIYYMNVHADDHYIYATYWGKEPWGDRIGTKMPFINTIHAFDWNGTWRYKLITDQSYLRVWSDPIRNRLYTMNMETEEVFYLDLEELNLNEEK